MHPRHMCYQDELLSTRVKISRASFTQLEVHQTARPGLRTVNSGFCIGFSEGSSYQKYTVYNKEMNDLHVFPTPRIFSYSFYYFIKILLNHLLILQNLYLDFYDRPYNLHLSFTALEALSYTHTD